MECKTNQKRVLHLRRNTRTFAGITRSRSGSVRSAGTLQITSPKKTPWSNWSNTSASFPTSKEACCGLTIFSRGYCVTRTSPRRWISTWRRWAATQRPRWRPWKPCVQLLCNQYPAPIRGWCRKCTGTTTCKTLRWRELRESGGACSLELTVLCEFPANSEKYRENLSESYQN